MVFPALPVGRLPSWIEDCGFGGSTMQKPLTIADYMRYDYCLINDGSAAIFRATRASGANYFKTPS